MRLSVMLMLLLALPLASGEITDHAGYPQPQPNNVANAITVKDINNDGIPEIIVAPHIRSVRVYDTNGNLLWKGIAGTETASNTVSPLAADVNGDGYSEVLLAGGTPGDQAYMHSIYIWNPGGILLKSYDLGNGYAPSTPAFANGIILVGISGSFTGMNAYDMSGLRWQLPFSGGSERMNGIAVGDLDGDGRSEAVLAGGGKVTVVNAAASGGSVRWQKDVTDPISPVIINVSGKKVVAASGSSGTFAWDAAGGQLWSSAVASKYYINTYSSPAVSDLNSDGSDDVILVNDFSVYAISGIDGSILPGFPVSAQGSFRARPAIYDINKDSKPEIIIGDSNGNLYIRDSTGALLDGFPVRITNRVKSMHSSPDVYDLEGDGIPEVVIGSATHLHVVSVKTKSMDATPPVTADDADDAWHNSSVTITLTAKDEESGAAATYYTVDGSIPTKDSATGTTIALSGDGVYTIRYFSVDNAGNTEQVKTAANQVKIDKTPPSTTDNSDGEWHNGSVTVKLTASDNLAGVRSTGYKVNSDTEAVIESFIAWLRGATGLEEAAMQGDTISLSDEGVFSIRYSSLDNAGNIEAEKTSQQVKIDRTPPVITVNSPQNKTYLHSDIITLGFAAQDELSGIKTMSSAIDGAVHVSDGQAFDMLGLVFGAHEFYISAEDNAGNLNSRKVSFNVIATIESLSALTERGSASGAVTGQGGYGVWITSNGVANSLRAKVNSARAKINAGQNTAAKNILEAYVNEVEAQTGKGITSEGAGILGAEARYVIEHL